MTSKKWRLSGLELGIVSLESGALPACPFQAGTLIVCRAVYLFVHCAQFRAVLSKTGPAGSNGLFGGIRWPLLRLYFHNCYGLFDYWYAGINLVWVCLLVQYNVTYVKVKYVNWKIDCMIRGHMTLDKCVKFLESYLNIFKIV